MHGIYSLSIVCLYFLSLIYMEVWNCKLPSFCQQCNPVYHSAIIRICTGAFRTIPIARLYVDSGEQSLKYRETNYFCNSMVAHAIHLALQWKIIFVRLFQIVSHDPDNWVKNLFFGRQIWLSSWNLSQTSSAIASWHHPNEKPHLKLFE